MISGNYLLSAVLLTASAIAFDHGLLTATTQTKCWMVVFFFASAGASAAYLTVSEIFPLELGRRPSPSSSPSPRDSGRSIPACTAPSWPRGGRASS